MSTLDLKQGMPAQDHPGSQFSHSVEQQSNQFSGFFSTSPLPMFSQNQNLGVLKELCKTIHAKSGVPSYIEVNTFSTEEGCPIANTLLYTIVLKQNNNNALVIYQPILLMDDKKIPYQFDNIDGTKQTKELDPEMALRDKNLLDIYLGTIEKHIKERHSSLQIAFQNTNPKFTIIKKNAILTDEESVKKYIVMDAFYTMWDTMTKLSLLDEKNLKQFYETIEPGSRLKNKITFADTSDTIFNGVGKQIKATVKFTVSRNDNQQMAKNVPFALSAEQNVVTGGSIIELVPTKKAVQGQNGLTEKDCYIPRHILSVVNQENTNQKASNLNTVLLAMIGMVQTAKDREWQKVFKKSILSSGKKKQNHKDISILATKQPYQFSVGGVVSLLNEPGIFNSISAEQLDSALLQFLDFYFDKGAIYSVEVPLNTFGSFMYDDLLEASQNIDQRNKDSVERKQKAINNIITFSNLLTGNRFSEEYKSNDNPMAEGLEADNIVRPTGHYRDENGDVRDIADLDYLYLLNREFFTKDESLTREYLSLLYPVTPIHPLQKIERFKNLYSMVFPNVEFTGYVKRVTFKNTYIEALVNAFNKIVTIEPATDVIFNNQIFGNVSYGGINNISNAQLNASYGGVTPTRSTWF